MGFDSIWHWIILLIVILLIFGTGKLTNVGNDLGKAIRGFKKAVHDDDDENAAEAARKPDPLKSEAAPETTDAKDPNESGSSK